MHIKKYKKKIRQNLAEDHEVRYISVWVTSM